MQQNPLVTVDIHADGWIYQGSAGQLPVAFTWPVFEIDGRSTASTGLQWSEPSETTLANECVESRRTSPISEGLDLTLVLRIAPDSPVVRFRYELSARPGMKMTRSQGVDAITYGRLSLAGYPTVTEVRLSEFVEVHHCYELNEVPVAERDFEARQQIMGPILAASTGAQSLALAYEHGSTWPDAFLAFELSPDRQVVLKAVHGNTFDGQPADHFATVWFLLGSVAGTLDDIATTFRQFLRARQALNQESRKPYIFYNTWNHQERNKHWHGKPYLADMNQERMLQEIEAAHQMGIDVFVIDTGWFRRTGDWQVNLDRFPDGLKGIKQALDKNGMKLGLWFDRSAGIASDVLHRHMDCRVSSEIGGVWSAETVWETEPAYRMCLVSRYWEAFADELIRVHEELGVSYFKWDAIDQYGCTDPNHSHGSGANSEQERADSCAFQLPLYLAKIVEKISRACPEIIVDFDVTETRRALGLAFLSAGKFFLINNGPYCASYDLPKAGWPNGNPNLFFHPGPARTWICRQPLTFDKWVPMNLFLTHYLPDDGVNFQVNCVASLILGQNGIWGDLLSVSPEGVATLRTLLDHYKRVRDDMAAAHAVRRGLIGGASEIHEKINPSTGRGAVVLFATTPGTVCYATDAAVCNNHWATPGVEVTALPDGRAKIVATFVGERSGYEPVDQVEWAKIVYFGTSPQNTAA